MLATDRGHLQIASDLIQAGADVNIQADVCHFLTVFALKSLILPAGACAARERLVLRLLYFFHVCLFFKLTWKLVLRLLYFFEVCICLTVFTLKGLLFYIYSMHFEK